LVQQNPLPERQKHNVGFVTEGFVRFCYYNNKGEEINHLFIDENNFVSDQQKIVSRFLISLLTWEFKTITE
jgi:hypothetical protein